jgi:predicted nucleic acid-binding protein
MTGRFLDTNILLYSISGAPEEQEKRQIAIALLDDDSAALSVQVLQEFYVQATRASRPDRLDHGLAEGLVRTWLRFRVQEMTVSVMQQAFAISSFHRISYWDSAIIAAARALGCRELLTEDLTHGREVEGVRIINPFIATEIKNSRY